jgi:hypothetical protein
VCRVFPFGDGPVVATEAGSDDRRVIDSCRYPATGVMTVLTGWRGQDVTRIFALGDYAIVATDTITADADMIVACAHPGDRIVTVIAGITAHYVPGIFSFGDNPVVATLATPDHCHVVNSKHIGPYCRRVTNLAFSDDAYMLTGRGAGLYPT